MPTVAQLNAILRADVGGFITGMNAAGASLDKLGEKGKSVAQGARDTGAALTKYVSLPLAAVGAAAIDVSLKFEESFANIKGLVGVSDDQLAQFRTSIEALGPATGKGPAELADALYFITSAGLEGDRAMQALERSATASAAGLGDVATVADLLTSAMNAYEKSGLTAAKATDVLTATVKEGKAEPEELASSMGRVIPVASALGVSFEEVGGAVAVMTKSGLNAAEATTALRGILTQLSAPTDQAKEALASVGLTANDLRDTLKNKGLLDLLLMLQDRFGGNSEALSALFGDVRGLVGYLNIMGQDAAGVRDVFDSVTQSTGATDAAFNAVADTAGFKMKQAMASLQTSMVKAGDTVLPMLAGLGEGVAGLADGFSHMPAHAQTFAVQLGAVAIAAGPVLNIVGRMIPMLQSAGSAIAGVAGSFKGANFATFGMDAARSGEAAAASAARTAQLGKAAAGTGAAIGASLAIYGAWTTMMNDAAQAGRNLADKALTPIQQGLAGGNLGIEDARAKMQALEGQISAIGDEMNDSHAPWDADYRNSLKAGNEQLQATRDQMDQFVRTAEVASEVTGVNADEFFRWLTAQKDGVALSKNTSAAIDAYNKAQLEATGLTKDQAAATADMGQQYVDAQLAIDNAKKALKDWADAVQAQFDPLFAMQDAMRTLTDSQLGVTDAQKAYTEAVNEHGYASLEAQQAALDLEAAQQKLLESNVDLDVAGRQLTQGIKDGSVSMTDATHAIDSWAASGRITTAQAEAMKTKLYEAAWAAQVLDQQSPLVTVNLDASAFWAEFNRVKGELGTWSALTSIPSISRSAATNPKPTAMGGVFHGPQVRLLAEAGSEAVVPLGNPARAQQVMAEAGLTGSGGDTYVFNISGFVGNDRDLQDKLVEVIRRAERERGS